MNMLKTHPIDTLKLDHEHLKQISLKQLFADDPSRFQKFSLKAAGLFLDYSKNRITDLTFTHLIYFANAAGLPAQIEALFSGEWVNNTEERPALHPALRDSSDPAFSAIDPQVTAKIQESLVIMQDWVTQLHDRQWLGYSQKPITDIVHIGIGGSYLGPLASTEALMKHPKALPCHFAASIDSVEIEAILQTLNPETTLFIIASKTFTTQETLLTAEHAKTWLRQSAGTQDISKHFIAITANIQNAIDYGISNKQILAFEHGVGGRYSSWSGIGLPIAICVGMTAFRAFLAGAHDMDLHFRNAPFHANMPVILALLGFWYIQFFKSTHHAILPYDYRLRSLPRYLQQLDMESNGKCVQKNGEPVWGNTAPVLFGEIGTNGQHSFHQLLFQGTHVIPCDFIATIQSEALEKDRSVLLSHCLAQSQGLMLGKSARDIEGSLIQNGMEPQKAQLLAKHKAIPGNQPSNTLLISKLTPQTLGSLMALYEHKTFVQGVLWNINSFDQWGVELGKDIAKELLACLKNHTTTPHQDVSTQGLLDYIYKHTAN